MSDSDAAAALEETGSPPINDDIAAWRRWDNQIKMAFLWAFHVIAVLFAVETFEPRLLILALALGVLTTLGVEMGYHRMLVHRAFEAEPALRYGLTFLGMLAVQQGPVSWVANHRKHHRYSDDPDEDPHSPTRSFLWSHIGWLYGNDGLLMRPSYCRRWAPDILKDPVLRTLDKIYEPLTVLSWFAFLSAGWDWFVWAYCVRVVVTWHFQFAINSVCHTFGSQPWDTGDRSRNFAWLALPTLGEAWHNNHHHAPRSARVGFLWWQLDPTWYLIWSLEKVGLVWNVVRPVEADAARAQPA